MPYTTAQDVRDSIKSFAKEEGDDLTDDKINKFITREGAVIDGHLGGYVLPIDENKSPKSFEILKAIHTDLVLTQVEMYMKIQTGGEESSQAVTDKTTRLRMAMGRLKKIKKNEIVLTDAPRVDLTASHFGERLYEGGKYLEW